MLTPLQLVFLQHNKFKKSDLVTADGTYWLYGKTHAITVKKKEYHLFLVGDPYNNKPMVLLATIKVELPLADFIVLMNAFHFVEI
jgi:hypothetical protein